MTILLTCVKSRCHLGTGFPQQEVEEENENMQILVSLPTHGPPIKHSSRAHLGSHTANSTSLGTLSQYSLSLPSLEKYQEKVNPGSLLFPVLTAFERQPSSKNKTPKNKR